MEQWLAWVNDEFEEWNIEDENLESPARNQLNDTYIFVNSLILNKGKWTWDEFKIKINTAGKVCNPHKIKIK